MTKRTDAEINTSRKMLFYGSIVAWGLITTSAIKYIYDLLGTQQYFYVHYEHIVYVVLWAMGYSIIGMLFAISLIRYDTLSVNVK